MQNSSIGLVFRTFRLLHRKSVSSNAFVLQLLNTSLLDFFDMRVTVNPCQTMYQSHTTETRNFSRILLVSSNFSKNEANTKNLNPNHYHSAPVPTLTAILTLPVSVLKLELTTPILENDRNSPLRVLDRKPRLVHRRPDP